jgi:hypothetical protein
MSEVNLLNATLGDGTSPDYGYVEQLPPEILAAAQMQDGALYTRRANARGRIIDLVWNARLQADCDRIRQWEAQYEQGFFTYADYERTRYYSGKFASPLQYSPAGFNKWNVKGQFVELPGRAMYQYPTNWARDAIMLDDTDDFGNVRWKFTGAWGQYSGVEPFGGSDYFVNVTNSSAEMIYFGYGFRVWARKQGNLGQMSISLDGTLLTTVDLYNAAAIAAAVVYTNANVSLGFHRVKLACAGTKNAGSSDFYVIADAIQVMR